MFCNVIGDQRTHLVTVGDHGRSGGKYGFPEAIEVRRPRAGSAFPVGELPPHPSSVERGLNQRNHASGVSPKLDIFPWAQGAEYLVRGPAHSRDSGDTKAFIYLRPAGVIDPSDHSLHAEGFPSNPCGDDVGIIAMTHRGERISLSNAGGYQHSAIETVPSHYPASKTAAQAAECGDISINDGDGMACVGQTVGERRSRPAAPHNHHMHAVQITRLNASCVHELDSMASTEPNCY